MRAAARALPAFEIAVGGRRATLAGLESIGIHAEAHRAAGLAPFEARVAENAVETFLLGLHLHQPRALPSRPPPSPTRGRAPPSPASRWTRCACLSRPMRRLAGLRCGSWCTSR